MWLFLLRLFPLVPWNREKAENDIHDFLEQIRPTSKSDTAIFTLQDYGNNINSVLKQPLCISCLFLSTVVICVFVCFGDLEVFLVREREVFRIATVEPVHQLRDDLCFRLGEVQHQQPTVHPSNWEQVIQQVPLSYEMKTWFSVHCCNPE